ncbi:MAG: S8 family peptidase [Candidatus Methylomirabilales bacterium]
MARRRSIKRTKVTMDAGLPRVVVHRVAQDTRELRALAEEVPERINWAQRILGIPRVWQITQGEGVEVAVLDTGIDVDHPDLADAIVETKDFTGEGIEDTNGHGTHVAGIIAARLNDVGFVGVAPKAGLLAGKVLGKGGRGSFEWIAQGIEWAIAKGAHVISMSLGGSASTHRLFVSVHEALVKGRFIVCAAGNEGSLFQNSIGFPGRYGGVITAASHDENGNPSGFSSRGGEVDFMAPGSNIWSTYKDGGYATLSGTSMATPFVAGLAALIISKHLRTATNKTLLENNEDLREHLMRMATHPGHHDNASGYGPLQPFQYFG